jgi:hypothetical protein
MLLISIEPLPLNKVFYLITGYKQDKGGVILKSCGSSLKIEVVKDANSNTFLFFVMCEVKMCPPPKSAPKSISLFKYEL